MESFIKSQLDLLEQGIQTTLNSDVSWEQMMSALNYVRLHIDGKAAPIKEQPASAQHTQGRGEDTPKPCAHIKTITVYEETEWEALWCETCGAIKLGKEDWRTASALG